MTSHTDQPGAVPSPVLFATARRRESEPESAAPNEALVSNGLRILRAPLALFVCQGIAETYGDAWWRDGVLELFVHSATPTVEDVLKRRRLRESGTLEQLSGDLDVSSCLILLTKQWSRIFGAVLQHEHRGWAYELIGVRNENKHLTAADHESDYAWRALDTMYRLAISIAPETATELRALRARVDLEADRTSPLRAAANIEATEQAVRATAPEGAHERRPFTEIATTDDIEVIEDLALAAADFSNADLRGMDFTESSLVGADFSGADLRDASFKGSVLRGAIFTGARLGGANLTGADLTNAHFEKTSLSYEFGYKHFGARFTNAKLDGATLNFTGSDLRDVAFAGTTLRSANFSSAKLGGANFTGTDLTNAHFEKTSLSYEFGYKHFGARFTNAKLDGATLNFTGSNLRHVDFAGTTLHNANFSSAKLGGANFTGTDLTNAHFEKTSLSYEFGYKHFGARFTNARLDGATLNFTGSNLRHVDFAGTTLHNANFSSAKLGGANFTGTDLTNAHFEKTSLSYEFGYKHFGARFTNAKLDGATLNFTGSDLRGAILHGANLQNAVLTNARLEDADLTGADLRGAALAGSSVKAARSQGARWS